MARALTKPIHATSRWRSRHPSLWIVGVSTIRHVNSSSLRHIARPRQPVQPMFGEPIVHHLLADVLRRAPVQPCPALELLARFGRNKEAERYQPLPRGGHLALSLAPLP